MSEVTFEQVEAEVRRLAAENPDYVYESGPGDVCFYNPSEWEGHHYEACIFGRALSNLGVPVPSAQEGRSIDLVLAELRIVHTEFDASWSNDVQHAQDHGVPWGEAVRNADGLNEEY